MVGWNTFEKGIGFVFICGLEGQTCEAKANKHRINP